MATLQYQNGSLSGGAVVMAPASAGGDKVAPHSRGALLITNGGGSAITATIATPGNTQFGQAQPDVPISVPAGTTRLVTALTQDLADMATDGLIAITYSGVTSVTVAAIAI